MGVVCLEFKGRVLPPDYEEVMVVHTQVGCTITDYECFTVEPSITTVEPSIYHNTY